MIIKKLETLKSLNNKIIAIIRSDNEKNIINGLEILIDAGIDVAELSLTVPFAHKILEKITVRFEKKCLIGAGTVLDGESARIAIMSGAQFIITPSYNSDTLHIANRYGTPVIPGVCTPTEAVEAMSHGADVIKLFPASNFQPSYIGAFKAPLPNLGIIPVGGIAAENISDWKRNGAFAYGVGGNLTSGINNGDFESVKLKAEELLNRLGDF